VSFTHRVLIKQINRENVTIIEHENLCQLSHHLGFLRSEEAVKAVANFIKNLQSEISAKYHAKYHFRCMESIHSEINLPSFQFSERWTRKRSKSVSRNYLNRRAASMRHHRAVTLKNSRTEFEDRGRLNAGLAARRRNIFSWVRNDLWRRK